MKGLLRTGWKLTAVLAASSALALAQTASYAGPQRSVPGAQPPVGPGTINYVEGQASLNGGELAPQSVGGTVARPGDVVSTGNGYVEVLLTPGAFLRLGHDSQIRLNSAGLADTNLQLMQGAAVLEVDQLIQGTHLAIQVNGATATVDKKGLYEFDGSKQAIRVVDGKLVVTDANRSTDVEKGKQVLLASNHPLKKRGFDVSSVKTEPLYVWSQARSEDEAQVSYNAARNATLYASAGPGWFWDPYANFYGFWPADAYLMSPFGWGFYSPLYFGFYGGIGGWYGYPLRYAGVYHYPLHGPVAGHVGGVNARVSGFGGGGFHAGFAGGGFHGGGGGHR